MSSSASASPTSLIDTFRQPPPPPPPPPPPRNLASASPASAAAGSLNSPTLTMIMSMATAEGAGAGAGAGARMSPPPSSSQQQQQQPQQQQQEQQQLLQQQLHLLRRQLSTPLPPEEDSQHSSALGPAVAALSAELVRSLRSFHEAAQGLQQLVGPQRGLGEAATTALRQLTRTAESIAELADYLERNPNALITGKKLPDQKH